MLETLRFESFQPLLDESFGIVFEADPVAARLTNVRALTPPSTDHEGRLPWSLVFRVPPDASYEQGIYRVHHRSFGEVELFLVPIGPDREGMQYEAVFT